MYQLHLFYRFLQLYGEQEEEEEKTAFENFKENILLLIFLLPVLGSGVFYFIFIHR